MFFRIAIGRTIIHAGPFRKEQWNRDLNDDISFILTTAGSGVLLQAGENKKSAPSEPFDEIDLNGFRPFKEVFVDDIGDTFQNKNPVIFPWFIQNQAQGGSRSAVFHGDADGRDFLLILQHFLNGLGGLL